MHPLLTENSEYSILDPLHSKWNYFRMFSYHLETLSHTHISRQSIQMSQIAAVMCSGKHSKTSFLLCIFTYRICIATKSSSSSNVPVWFLFISSAIVIFFDFSFLAGRPSYIMHALIAMHSVQNMRPIKVHS